MYDILSLLSVLYPHLSTTTVRQFSCVVLGLFAIPGYAKYLTLDVSRRELPDDPTLFQHRYPLGDCILGVFSHVSTGSRKHLYPRR